MSGDPHASPALRQCENCGTSLAGPYCHRCGQHAIDYRRSFHHLAHDVLENLFHFDGKFLVSVAWLLARPGKLTAEYNAGRRQSQVPPLRFYIFVTVLFFLGVHLLNHGHLFPVNEQAVDLMTEEVAGATRANATLTPAQQQRLAQLINQASEQKGKLEARDLAGLIERVHRETATPAESADGKHTETHVHIDESSAIGRAIKEKFASGELTFGQAIEEMEHRVPTLLFLGMPLYALWLRLFFRGSKRYYIEHLVFSLHLHTWAFLALMIGGGYLDLAGLGPDWLGSLVGWTLFGWMLWYTVAAARTVYGQGWPRTAIKMAALAGIYLLTVIGLGVGMVTLTLIWLAYA